MTFCGKAARVEMDSLARCKTYWLPLPHQARDAASVLSSLGWIFASYSNYEARLFHPMTGADIAPPRLSTNKISAGVVKFVLSARPPANASPAGYYRAIIMHDNEDERLQRGGLGVVAFWKAGDAAWTRVKTNHALYDMVYSEGRVFAFNEAMEFQIFHIGDGNGRDSYRPTMRLRTNMLYWKVPYDSTMIYVVAVESERVALVVHVERPLCSHRPTETVLFRVYKWRGWEEEGGHGGVLEQVFSLGGKALFLCNNSLSFTVKALDYQNCEADCIYFADDFRRLRNSAVSDSDVGIFRLKDGSSERPFRIRARGCLFAPLWLQPTFS